MQKPILCIRAFVGRNKTENLSHKCIYISLKDGKYDLSNITKCIHIDSADYGLASSVMLPASPSDRVDTDLCSVVVGTKE